MVKKFDEILEECLERLLVREKTVEQCLERYPEQAAELKPLLETTIAARKAMDIQPRPDFQASARYQFRTAIADAVSRRKRPIFGWLPHWGMATSVGLGLVLLISGTVGASGYSMPDNPLYPLKLATEQVQLRLTPSAISKAELYGKLADRRVTEMVYMAKKGDAGKVEMLVQRFDESLTMLTGVAATIDGGEAPEMLMAPSQPPMPSGGERAPVSVPGHRETGKSAGAEDAPADTGNQAKLRIMVTRYASNHPAALRAILEKAPPSARPMLLRAISLSEARYAKALESLH